MKYLIFLPIYGIYILLLSIIVGIICLWAFDFNKFELRRRKLDHAIGFGYWIDDIL
jgi:hypothetical protein